jgi:hypothetical protein
MYFYRLIPVARPSCTENGDVILPAFVDRLYSAVPMSQAPLRHLLALRVRAIRYIAGPGGSLDLQALNHGIPE